MLFLVVLSTVAGVRGIYSFLAVEDSVPGGVLVAEGWAPDHALAEGLAEFRRHHYEGIYATGIPMELGAVLSDTRPSPT